MIENCHSALHWWRFDRNHFTWCYLQLHPIHRNLTTWCEFNNISYWKIRQVNDDVNWNDFDIKKLLFFNLTTAEWQWNRRWSVACITKAAVTDVGYILLRNYSWLREWYANRHCSVCLCRLVTRSSLSSASWWNTSPKASTTVSSFILHLLQLKINDSNEPTSLLRSP